MDAFTTTELDTLRSHPQGFQPRLAVFKPAILWTGIISNTPSKGDRTLTIQTTSGSFAKVLPGMTLIADPGINEQSYRIRSASGSTIIIEENSYDWSNGLQLKILMLFGAFSIKNRIVQNGTTVTYYEDYDIQYTDENELFSPVLNIGPAAIALELDCEASGTYTDLDLKQNESFVFDSTILSYQWGILFGDNQPYDAEIIGSSTSDSVTFRFWRPGDYYIYCTGTAANGKSRTAYRAVMVRCDSPGHTYSPFYNFQFTSLNGSRDSGYWSSKISIFEKCDQEKLPRNVPIVIYGNYTYGSGSSRSTSPIPWYYEATAHQKFVGWIMEELWTKEYTDESAVVSFDAVGVCGLFDQTADYSLWLQYKTSPSDWTEIVGLSSDRLLYFLLHNRTTLLNITDWHKIGTTKLTQYAEVAQGKIYSGLRDFLRQAEYADLVSDRCSALWSEFDGRYLTDSNRSPIVTDVMTITDLDRMDQVNISVTRDKPETSWLSIDGLEFDGSNNIPRISYAPGYVMDTNGGNIETTSGLIIGSQNDLNILAGRVFAVANNPLKEIEMNTMGNYPFDIAPQTSLHYDGFISGTFREETIQDADLYISSIDDKYVPEMAMTSNMKFEVIVRDGDAQVGPGIPKAPMGVEGLFPPDITGPDPDQFNIDWGNFGDLFDWPSYDNTIPDTANNPGINIASTPATYAKTINAIGRIRTGNTNWEHLFDASDIYTSATIPRIISFRLDPWDPKNTAYVLMDDNNNSPMLYRLDDLDSATPSVNLVLDINDFFGDSMHVCSGSSPERTMDLSINVRGFIVIFLWFDTHVTANGTRLLIRRGTTAAWEYTDYRLDNGDNFSSVVLGHYADGPTVGKIYAMELRGDHPSNYATIKSSDDMGETFDPDTQFTSYPFSFDNNIAIEVPYGDNQDDSVYYAAIGIDYSDNYNSIIRRSETGSHIGISPNDGSGYFSARQIWTYTFDKNQVVVLGYSNYAGIVEQMFISLDGGTTWEKRDNPDSYGMPHWIGGWPFNKEILFAVGRARGGPDFGHLFLCENFISGGVSGATWTDFTFDFYSVVDASASVSVDCIAPVWVS